MALLRRASLVLSAVLTAATSIAQRPIYIVDASGGAGSQFTDLPAAVAAVPDGSVLIVRPGTYTPFSVSGKGLSIVGEDAAQVVVSDGVLDVRGTSPSQTFLVRSITLGSLVGVAVSVQHARGAVLWEDISQGILANRTGFDIVDCDNVQLHGCSLKAAPVLVTGNAARITATDSTVHISRSTLYGSLAGFSALSLRRSRAVVVDSTLMGGVGAEGCCSSVCSWPVGPGGEGVVLHDRSTLILLRSAVIGGSEGVCQRTPSCAGSGNPCGGGGGGTGVVVAEGSRALVEGIAPAAGYGFPAGSPFTIASGGTIQINASSTPSAGEILGEQEVGKTIRFALDAKPNSIGVLLFATQPTLVPLEPLTLGSLLSGWSVTFPVMVPGTGMLEVPFGIPSTYPLGETYYWQFLTIEPGFSALWATNSFALHVNR